MTPQAVAEAALKPCTHCSGWAPHRRNVHRETGEVAHYQENYGAACQLAARARDWDNKKKWAEEKKRKRESLAVDPVVGPAPVDPVRRAKPHKWRQIARADLRKIPYSNRPIQIDLVYLVDQAHH